MDRQENQDMLSTRDDSTIECEDEKTEHISKDADMAQIDAFLCLYRERAREILEAMEKGQWQRAWLLVKNRDRFCRPDNSSSKAQQLRSGVGDERICLSDKSVLRELYKEVKDIDERCVRLVKKEIGTIQMEVRFLNTLKRWRLSQVFPAIDHSRFVDAEG